MNAGILPALIFADPLEASDTNHNELSLTLSFHLIYDDFSSLIPSLQ